MATRVRDHLVPPSQRRTLDELLDDLDLRRGDVSAKRSAFWTMLLLSGVIASAGVLADSTATVIGAMIIAPLSTPILGLAVALVMRRRNGSLIFVMIGAASVIAIGFIFSFVVPDGIDLRDNSQIAGRVSPTLLDLMAALATGLAGATAFARRDVAAILPGVAIAISLVPPLAVVGICLGHGSVVLAIGALLLFTSNLVSLVVAGVFVFAVLGYVTEIEARIGSSQRARLVLTTLMAVVLVPMAANTAVQVYSLRLQLTIQEKADQWAAAVPGAEVEDVDHHLLTFRVHLRAPSPLPPLDGLREELEGEVPSGIEVEVVDTRGSTIEVGEVSPSE